MMLADDLLRYEVCQYADLTDMLALVSVSHHFFRTLLATAKRRAMKQMQSRLEKQLRPVRAAGQCALCSRNTLHLVDMSTDPARVYEGGPYCSRHCLRMQNVTPDSLMCTLMQEFERFPVIGIQEIA